MPNLEMPKTTKAFQFFTRLHLAELTGLKARNLQELLSHVKTVPDSVIYYHTHDFLEEHQYLLLEPPNGFAYWATTALNEIELGEKLASINNGEFSTLRTLRDKIAETIEKFLEKRKEPLREANEGREFHFLKSISFVLPTPYTAHSLEEFIVALKKVTIHSIYFHMFEARLRLEKGTNDFSLWLEGELEEKELAKKITKFDPYNLTGEGVRTKIIRLAEARLKETRQ